MEFENRVAVVTGASTGIGAATAVLLARKGAVVAVNYAHSRDQAEKLVEEIKTFGGRAVAIQADVTQPAEVSRLAEVVHAELGLADFLIHNAGGLLGRMPIREMTLDLWHRTMDLNLHSTFMVCQAFMPDMVGRRFGRIVTVSSISARNGGGIGASAYAASKAGAWAFTKGLAKEVAEFGISVNSIAPGYIDTPFHTKAKTGDLAQFTGGIPMKRIGTPEEAAEVIAFLCSGGAAYVTGVMVDINGGLLMP